MSARAAVRPERTRTPVRDYIQVVAQRPRGKTRPRVFYAFITVSVIFGIIVAQLLVSVAVSSGAYEIAALQRANREAGRNVASATQDLDRLASPQNLASNAEVLGMVNNSTPVYLRLSDGAVLGSPAAASPAAGVISGNAGPLVPNSLLTNVPLVTKIAADAQAATAKAAADAAAAKAAADAAEAAKKAATVAVASAPAPGAPAAPIALTNGLPAVSTR
jgi:hypothetical protein